MGPQTGRATARRDRAPARSLLQPLKSVLKHSHSKNLSFSQLSLLSQHPQTLIPLTHNLFNPILVCALAYFASPTRQTWWENIDRFMMARKGKEVASASIPSRTRTTKNSNRGRDDGFPAERFDSRIHYDRWKTMENRGIMHKRIIRFPEREPNFMHDRIEGFEVV
ncbi:hypothetical protein PIB30_067518 [Stylosanthes scabra]|uniref:Uncharacterized protein n=1 Tax=Stylosanthes scabra TaxID=79078 RepID=A0ABU6XMN3_9FABA|nr:hypothetical protein [Stylosanthes scabra]